MISLFLVDGTFSVRLLRFPVLTSPAEGSQNRTARRERSRRGRESVGCLLCWLDSSDPRLRFFPVWTGYETVSVWRLSANSEATCLGLRRYGGLFGLYETNGAGCLLIAGSCLKALRRIGGESRRKWHCKNVANFWYSSRRITQPVCVALAPKVWNAGILYLHSLGHSGGLRLAEWLKTHWVYS